MQVTDETKSLAQEIVDYFHTYPERHEQDTWVFLHDGKDDEVYLPVEEYLTEANVCNTTMCIAGSAVFLTRPLSEFKKFYSTPGEDYDWEIVGGRLLGLESNEAFWLFYDTNNATAIDAVTAIANGDVDKFTHLMEHGIAEIMANDEDI